jgi:two-component system chemotaxis sensor kinase CheA
VAFDDDLELQRLFGGEVAERSELLVQGARKLASGDVSDALLDDMHREGHTIKGTARMMGFNAVSDAGKLLEDAWREIRNGDRGAPPGLAAALETLSAELLPAISADPATGTPALAAGMRAVRGALKGEPADEANSPAAVVRIGTTESGDLGGLLGTLDSWAFGESIRVDAAGLYRLINEVCALRVDAEAIQSALGEVTRSLKDPSELDLALVHLGDLVGRSEKAIVDLQGRAVDLAAAPLSEVTSTFPQLVRYLARKANKDIRFELVGDHQSADRQVLDRLGDPLRQLLVNAIEHGIEPASEREANGKPPTATIAIRFEVVDHRLGVVVEDDGAGVDWASVRAAAARKKLVPPDTIADTETLRSLLFAPNFSTTGPSELVGDGMGLATVAAAIESLHGTIVLESEAGSGTRVIITVPTSRALQDAVLIRAAGQVWGIPEIAVLDRVPIDRAELSVGQSRLEMAWQGSVVPVSSFAEVVGLRDPADPTCILVVSSPVGPVGLSVAEDLGRRQVAARELGPVLDGVPHLTGAALLGGGDVVVLVDPARLAERARAVPDADGPRRRVLVVDDSRGARQIVGGALGSAGFEVDLAGSPTEALSVLAAQSFDAIVLDYVLPTMDGATLAGHVRGLGIEAPIVILSGAATAADQSRALASGADAYLDKDDVRQGALAALIRELIG